MRAIKIILLIFFMLIVGKIYVFAQVDSTFSESDTSGFSTFFTYSEEEMSKYLEFKPILKIGIGSFTFLGDVRNTYYQNPFIGNKPIMLGISRKLNTFLSMDINVTKGYITGIERTTHRNLNFKSDIFIGNVQLRYNFEHLLKKKDVYLALEEYRTLIPFVGVGIETMNFNPKADMYDANGNLYHYWSDGTLRDKPETPENIYTSHIIHRDYVFETDLRSLNSDGLGKYNLSSLGIPLSAGVNFYVNQRLILEFGATYHLLFSDLIDNVSSAGEGERKGDSKGDRLLNAYVAVKFDIFSAKKVVDVGQDAYADVDFAQIDKMDSDGDGVIDLWDEYPETPPNVKVYQNGCPEDDDKDGIPNYRDDEVHSPDTAIVNTKGVTLTEQEIVALSDTNDAITEDEICLYYPSMCGITIIRRHYTEIPNKFKFVDTNKDGYIDLDELNTVVDKFFDFEIDLTADDITELTEFFFSQ